MKTRWAVRCLGSVVLVLGGVFLAACTPPRNSTPDPAPGQARPPALIHQVAMAGSAIQAVRTFPLPDSAIRSVPIPGPVTAPLPFIEMISPQLAKVVEACREGEERECNRRFNVFITFTDSLQLPRLPEPVLTEPPTSQANQDSLALADSIIKALAQQRERRVRGILQPLGLNAATDDEYFWLSNALQTTVSVREIAMKLLGVPDVLAIECSFIDDDCPTSSLTALVFEGPASCGTATDLRWPAVEDGRDLIGSDPYFQLNERDGMRGWIGLLDTGVNSANRQLSDPSFLRRLGDCVNGGETCLEKTSRFDPGECPTACGHGTSTAAILVANDRQHPKGRYRGVTHDVLDAYKVYKCIPGTQRSQRDLAALLRGFQAALAALDKVIVVEAASIQDLVHHSVLSRAANHAYDMGSAVIATVGDGGHPSSPAVAAKVIGVGTVKPDTVNSTWDFLFDSFLQSFGPTLEGRVKPDIQAPSYTWTASNAPVNDSLQSFQLTSGATPYAGGAASLLRNWLIRTADGYRVDPGQVYAQLILSGQRAFPFDPRLGAGPLRLPPLDGVGWWGQIEVGPREVVDIPLERPVTMLSDTLDLLDAALWWPDELFGAPTLSDAGDLRPFYNHNDINLYLIDPRGTIRASSTSIHSVFERARVPDAVSSGPWLLRIEAVHFDDPGDTQVVYWTAFAQQQAASE